MRIRAGPAGPPAAVDRVSVESLVDFEAALHVRDLVIPSDVTLLTPGDEIVAKVQAPRVEIEEEPVVAEGEEAAEGEGDEGATSRAMVRPPPATATPVPVRAPTGG